VERNPTQTDPEETSVCAHCGEEFQQPLLAELHSGSIIEEYYACPRCLTKVGEVEHERRAEAEEAEAEEAAPVEEDAPIIEVAKAEERQQSCPFYVGYLRKREKGSPIPEGCFTCSKMIECI
jgi:DNA-directed RNA polymerase subunit RPC12/RpoP